MLFRLAAVILLVACGKNSKVKLDQNVGGNDAKRVVNTPTPTPTGNNNDNTTVSIILNNLPKGVTKETSIDVSVTSNDGAKSYRYVAIAATDTDDGTVACKEATYGDSSPLSNNIAKSNLAVSKHRLCVKAENAAGEAEDYPTVFEWEIVSQLPSTSPCSPCTVGCTGWTYSSWTPSQALHCSTDAVKQIAASIRTCDSQCSECSTGSTLTRTVDGTKDCSTPQTPSTPTCASCAAGCTDWSYGAWTPSAANTCSDTQLQQTAAGTRTCDSECSQCNTSTSKTRSINGTKDCSTPTCASCAAGCTDWSYGAWTPSAANTCSDTQLQQTAAGTRTCDSECSQCSTSTSKSQIVDGTKSCPKHAVLILPALDTAVERIRSMYRKSTFQPCDNSPAFFAANSVPELIVGYSTAIFRVYSTPKARQTLSQHPTIEEEGCSKAGLENITYNTKFPLAIIRLCLNCCHANYRAYADIGSVRWDAATNTCQITAKWRN